MYLKRLEILGFKTFAQKTEILFPPGITAVLGPNGSGKSNVADAILWVLGEQNVRSLRGNINQDVIFAGNERRRPLGLAEVSLTIDNSSRILPLEFSEVTVTRRVYRSGEGEYFINRVACRLKDIYELFLDTGLGRDAYSMINQGEIDAILSVRSEDRRAIFEEAAGIKKYRHRKREAVKKLENTRQNLLRLHDIMVELEAQLGPLARQAEVARRYADLAGRLRAIELAWLGTQLRRLEGERGRLETLGRDLDTERARLDAELAAVRAEEATAQATVAQADEEREALRVKEAERQQQLTQAEAQIALTEERRAHADRQRAALEAEILDLERRVGDLAKRLQSAEQERGQQLTLVGEMRRQMEAQQAEAAQSQQRAATAEKDLEAERGRMLELARRQAGQRNQLAQLERQVQSGQTAVARLETESREAEAEQQRLEAQGTQAASRAEALNTEIPRLQERVSALRAAATTAEQAWKSATEASRTAEQQWRSLSARHAALAEMRDSYQGYEEGVRALLEAARHGRLAGRFRPLMDALRVAPELERAVEGALGPQAQAVLVDARAAEGALRFLRERPVGRVWLIRAEADGPAPDGSLAAQIAADADASGALRALLGRTVVAPNVDAALAAVGADGAAVTLDGEYVDGRGRIAAGTGKGGERASALLARRRELERLEGEVAAAAAAWESARQASEAAEAERERLRSEMTAQAGALEKHRVEQTAARREQERLVADLERARRAVSRSEEARKRTQAEQEQSRAELENLRQTVAGGEGDSAALEAEIARRRAVVDGLAAARRAAESAIGDLRVEVAGLEERARGSAAAARRQADGRTHAERQIAAKRQERIAALAETESLAAEGEEWRARVADLRQHAAEIAGEIAARNAARTGLVEAWEAFRARAADLASRQTEMLQRSHRAEVERTAAESEQTHLAAQLREEYDLAPAELTPDAAALETVNDPAGEIGRLRRQVRALGAVNLEAVEEHARLAERFQFLSEQRADLEEAQRRLHEAIREIDATTREKFLAAFHQIGAAFDEMFRRLFGGGQTELVLTDPEDLLETGVDIIVQPPGKKRQNLLLLSGGERALTAAAMLFALLKVKPSPFVVMDEVDAPLDEANVGRFGDVLREFSERSQFILITHNRGTMEVADTLYGVTMEEPGISKVLSLRLSEIADFERDQSNDGLAGRPRTHRHPLSLTP
jgi:chromosome segregation protein